MQQLPSTAPATLLRAAGIRPSVHRAAVLGYLLQHRTHPSADEIYRELSPAMPSLSRTTVYNTLHLLEQHDMVLAICTDSAGHQRYDSTDLAFHGHFVCRVCGSVTDIPVDTMQSPGLPEGAILEKAAICYTGICARCRHENV